MEEVLISSIIEARLLGLFKRFCIDNEKNQNKIRNILAYSKNQELTVYNIIKRNYNVELDEKEQRRMLLLVKAYLNKKSFRIPLPDTDKEILFRKQNGLCAICNTNIDNGYHADHIVPFKYVGDELENNWQLLCSKCNEQKSDSIDYQIKVLLNLK